MISTFDELMKRDASITNKKNRLKDIISSIFKPLTSYTDIEFKCYVAGGACHSVFTNDKINDIDLYFYDQADAKIAHNALSKRHSYTIGHHATTYGVRIGKTEEEQVLQRCHNFRSIEKLFETYDFTCCMCALPFTIAKGKIEVGDFVVDPRFIEAIMERKIIFNKNTKFPLSSLFRLEKYLNKGYRITTEELIKVCAMVSEIKINSFSDLEKNLNTYSNDYNERIDHKYYNPAENNIFKQLEKVVK